MRNTRTRLLIDGLFFQVVRELKNTDSRLDMERLFDPEFVASLSDREKFIAYEGIKQQLIEQGASQEEYDRVTEQAIEELEI